MRIQSGPICVQLPPATRAKRVFTIHHLPVYPPHRESPKRLEGTPGKQRNTEMTDFIEQNIIILQHYKSICNLNYFMIPWCFILHWLDWEDSRFMFVWKCSLKFTKISSISTLKKDLQDFFPQSQQVNLTQFVLQAWLQWRQEMNLCGCKET